MMRFETNTEKALPCVFFCGMCGVSMLSLALITKISGFNVKGSDINPSEQAVRCCRENGIPLFFSHDKENIEGCDVFVYTHALDSGNPEIIAAKERGVRIYTRSQYLALIESRYKRTVAVSGSHGKSTVTGLLHSVFSECKNTPTVLAGANEAKSGRAFELGNSEDMIYEACEYRRAFLDFHPTLAIILNIDREHTDVYPDLQSARDAYFAFAMQSQAALLNIDCESSLNVKNRLDAQGKKTYSFSLTDRNAFAYAENIRQEKGRYFFDLMIQNKAPIRDVKPMIMGAHNVKNAVAGAAVASILLNADVDDIRRGIENFRGMQGRLEYIGNVNDANIYDDYAHHPTEIKATLKTAKAMGYERIICIFQPHTYSRTHDLFKEFTESFSDADEVVFADIFPAREKNIYGISSADLASKTPNATYIKNTADILSFAEKNCKKGTLILTMGAGKMRQIAKILTENA